MSFEFKINQKYTLVIMGGFAIATRTEIETLGTDPANNRVIYKIGRKHKRYYTPDLKDVMVFQGHNLPFKLDSETNSFIGNARFNFVTDDVPALKAFISEKCLNPTARNLSHILVWGLDRTNIDQQTPTPLFEEEELKQLLTPAV